MKIRGKGRKKKGRNEDGKRKGSKSENKNGDVEKTDGKKGSKSETKNGEEKTDGKKKNKHDKGKDKDNEVRVEFERILREKGTSEEKIEFYLNTLGVGVMKSQIREYKESKEKDEDSTKTSPKEKDESVKSTGKENGVKHKEKEKDTPQDTSDPSYLISELENPTKSLIKKIRNELQTSQTFLNSFIEKEGYAQLVKSISNFEKIRTKTEEEITLLKDMLALIIIFMKQKSGREIVGTSQQVLNELALISYSSIPEIKKTVYDILAIMVATDPANYPIVLFALDNVAFKMKEKLRFENIVSTLRHETNASAKTSALTLINCLINIPENLFDRIAARNEFNRLGIEEILSSDSIVSDLDKTDNAIDKLQKQIDVFFNDMKQDEDEYNDEIENLNDGIKSIALDDPDAVFKSILQRVNDKPYIRKPFLNLLQRLLLLDMDKDKGHKEWLFIEQIAHQIAAKKKEIKLDQELKINSDELQIDMETQAEYENQIQSQLLKISKLQDRVTSFKTKYKEAKSKGKDIEGVISERVKEAREEMKSKMDKEIEDSIIIKKNEIEEEKQELTNKQDELLKEQILMKEEILLKQKQLSNTIIENEELNKKLSEAANNSAKELKKN